MEINEINTKSFQNLFYFAEMNKQSTKSISDVFDDADSVPFCDMPLKCVNALVRLRQKAGMRTNEQIVTEVLNTSIMSTEAARFNRPTYDVRNKRLLNYKHGTSPFTFGTPA